MNYLLDTHSFIWSIAQTELIPERTIKELRNPDNNVFVSAVNLWEISIKTRLKKIDLGGIAVDDLIWQAIQRNLTMVSKDSEFGKFIPYGLKLLWK